ncbi:MAG: glycine--tRNA ligase [Phycisphaeraceae bacterium]
MTATNESAENAPAPATTTKSMDDIVALCRRRGFIWQSSEIYGGINGFWDYGPMGAALKKNLKDAWWHDIIRCPAKGPDGKTLDIVPVDCTIIMHPKVWIASGHAAGFNDPMVDDKETNERFRADHIYGLYERYEAPSGSFESQLRELVDWANRATESNVNDPTVPYGPNLTFVGASDGEAFGFFQGRLAKTKFSIEPIAVPGFPFAFRATASDGKPVIGTVMVVPTVMVKYHAGCVPSPANRELKWLLDQIVKGRIPPNPAENPKAFSLTAMRQFNLMFETYVGAIQHEDNKAWLRPETAQGIFCNFWNITDTARVKVPFGIAQQGKAFRNEVTPRNFTFRSREFEQMEIEFFIRPPEACQPGELTPVEWYQYWRKARYEWWQSVGLAGDNLILREHDKEELAHYAKEGAGVCDVEYRFPFTAPGFGELEGIAHRSNFDLKAHAMHVNNGNEERANKMRYFDQERNTRYFPHVIEPSAGADRGTLALLCEAYTADPSRPSGVYMKFTPRMAPIKAGIFPLVNKDGMPEVAEKLYMDLRGKYAVEYDPKQTIGKRYARMDEVGTPYCFTIDGDTLKDQTVTVRHRDTQAQERIGIEKVAAFLAEKIG